MEKLTIENSTVTTTGIVTFANVGNYTSSGRFEKQADGKLLSLEASVRADGKQASVSLYDANQSITYSYPVTITPEQKIEMESILNQSVALIKAI